MNITYHYAALHYLNLWLSKERVFCDAFANSSDRHSQLRAIKMAAAHFRVARTLPTRCDVKQGLVRFEPVQRLLSTENAATIDEHVVARTIRFHEELSAEYDNRKVLSATSKFLWLKLRSPVIIYDSQVRAALGTAMGDYGAYVDAWHAKYQIVQQDIATACSKLVNVLDYSSDTSTATGPYVKVLARQEWFRNRVFDSYLWHGGGT